MKALRFFMSSVVIALAFGGIPIATAAEGAIAVVAGASPPISCIIRQKAWCVQNNGAAEITLTQIAERDSANSRVWKLRDASNPESVLMVIEPEGCRKNYADDVKALGFIADVDWLGSRWDEMRVSLRSDGGCTLRLLVTPYTGSDLEWAYSVGRLLLGACKDDACTVLVPTIGDATSAYRERFRRATSGR